MGGGLVGGLVFFVLGGAAAAGAVAMAPKFGMTAYVHKLMELAK